MLSLLRFLRISIYAFTLSAIGVVHTAGPSVEMDNIAKELAENLAESFVKFVVKTWHAPVHTKTPSPEFLQHSDSSLESQVCQHLERVHWR